MPIINRPPGKNGSEKRPDKASVADTQEQQKPEAPLRSDTRSGSEKMKSMTALYGVALALGIALPFASYYIYANINLPSEEGGGDAPVSELVKTTEQVDISTSLEQLLKIGSLASLSKKEFEQNYVSLVEAEKLGSQSVISALEIIINKNRQDMASYKEKLVALLLELNDIYIQDTQGATAQMHMAIATAEDNNSLESVRILKLSLQALEGAPSQGDLGEYMTAAIENKL